MTGQNEPSLLPPPLGPILFNVVVLLFLVLVLLLFLLLLHLLCLLLLFCNVSTFMCVIG
jgi:hypothetical protein